MGRSCKKYSCKITAAGRIIAPLSNDEIDYFAEKDARNLLDEGLIDAAEFENFKNLAEPAHALTVEKDWTRRFALNENGNENEYRPEK